MLNLFRYRFFLFATPFPYILGAAIAYHSYQTFHLLAFCLGLLGIVLASGGVETFNEYFDPADNAIRGLRDLPRPSRRTFYLGAGFFGAAFLIGLYLSWLRSLWVLLFAAVGFFAAAFYVGPPFRLAYKGLGEIVIFITYGPSLVLGSYYLQTLRLDLSPLIVSILPGGLILALMILNEIPDYYWDKISGKNNLVVKLGREKGSLLYGVTFFAIYILQTLAVIEKALPLWSLITWLSLPLAWKAIRLVRQNYDNPQALLPAVNSTIYFFLGFNIFFILLFLL